MRRNLRSSLNGLGLSEVITYTLVSQKAVDNALMPLGEAVALAAPMSEERKYVRTSLIMSLLECLAYNQNHKNENVNLFEISNVYAVNTQQERLAIVMSGFVAEFQVEPDRHPQRFLRGQGRLDRNAAQTGLCGGTVKL